MKTHPPRTLLALLEAHLGLDVGGVALDLALARAVGLDEVEADEEELALRVLDELDLHVLRLVGLDEDLLVPAPRGVVEAATGGFSVPGALRDSQVN